jgi:hypothetical protein
MRVRGKITAVCAASVLSALAASASAQAEPGFTADPQSPAGVEYAIPLDTARGQGGVHHGSPGSGGTPGSGTSTPGGTSPGTGSGGGSPALFGSGITPPKENGSKHAKPGGDGGSGSDKPARSGGRGSAVTPPVAASASYSSTGPVVGIVGAILLLGGGVGVMLRLRARRSSAS